MNKITLRLKYRTPNHSNDRRTWFAVVKEKHKAQDALLLAIQAEAVRRRNELRCDLLCIAFDSSTHAQNMEAVRLLSTASDTLASYIMTGRKTSRSKSVRKKSRTSKTKKRSSKS